MLQSDQFLPTLCSVFSPNTLILGVGSPLRSDDNAGLLLCDLLLEKGVNCIKCEYGLENCIDIVAERKPANLVIADAAFFEDGKPGDVILLSIENLVDTVQPVTTHSLPLKLVLEIMKYTSNIEKVYLIGIYPKTLELGCEVSNEVYHAVQVLAESIATCLEKESKR